MASGYPISKQFTPAVAGAVRVDVTFQAASTQSDFGAGVSCNLYMKQGGTTTNGASTGVAVARAAYSLSYAFNVAAGSLVEVGLFSTNSGATAVSYYQLNLLAEFNAS